MRNNRVYKKSAVLIVKRSNSYKFDYKNRIYTAFGSLFLPKS